MTETISQTDVPEPKKSKPWLHRVCHWVVGFAVFVLVLATLYFTLGRLLMPVAERQKGLVEEQLSTLLGTEVSIARLNADWYRLGPILGLEELEITFPNAFDSNEEVSHLIKQLYIKPDIVKSILNKSLVIEQLIVDEIHCELIEAEDGSWSLVGVPSGNSNYIDQVLDLLLSISDLQLIESQVILHTNSGSQLKVGNAYLQLQNEEQDHHLQAQLRLDGQTSPLQFSLEFEGDPRGNFSASAYLSLKELDLSKAIEGYINDDYAVEELLSSAQIWLNYGESKQWSIQGQLEGLSLKAQVASSDLAIDVSNGSTSFTVLQGLEQQWQIWLETPQFDFFNRPWESGDFYAVLDTQEDVSSMTLSAQSIDISIVSGMLNDISLPEDAKAVLETLHPSGFITNLQFKTNFLGTYPNGFDLSVNVEDIAVGAWSGAPSGSGINGYVQAGQSSGFVELDSQDFEIHLPRVFDNSWHYDFINARVHWDISSAGVKVSSNVIDVGNEGIHGRVQFELDNWRDNLGAWVTDLTIIVSALELDASQKSLYLPTLPDVEETMTWLDQALIEGEISNSGFVYRGLNSDNIVGSSTVQTFYNVDNGVLEFLPEWPHLENIKAYVKVSNNDVDVLAQGASISGINLGPTIANLGSRDQRSWLTVQGNLETSTALGLDFIRTSPISEVVGDYLSDWRAEGQIAVDIDLGIPIGNQSLGNSIEVAVLSENSSLEMPEFSLLFEDIRGLVNYSNVTGLTANGLSGSLFDFPLVSKIESFNEGVAGSETQATGTLISATGRASTEALQNWSGQPDFVKELLNLVEGEVGYSAEFRLFSEATEQGVLSRLDLKSELPGVAVDLPSPFYKEIDELRSLAIGIEFLEEREVIEVAFDNNFFTELFFEDEVMIGGQINFGSLNQDFEIRQVGNATDSLEIEPGLVVTGDLGYLNFDDWLAVSENFIDEDSEGAGIENTVRIVDLAIGNLSIFDVDFFQASVLVQRAGSSWDVYLGNEMIDGNIGIPDDDNLAWEVDLNYLRFPEDEEETLKGPPEEKIDVLGGVNPSELMNFNFSTAELSIGESNLGAWEFAFRTNGSGATISNLKMLADDTSITDLTTEAGANVDWRYVNGMHTSSFNGLLHAGDLATVLPSWGYGANVQSKSADFISNLQWPGSPVAFSIAKSTGQVDMNITNGRFVDINSDSAKLFAVFNFDAIVRRLQLDFSDIYEKGLAFDSIAGQLQFEEGLVRTQGQFLILGPSSTIHIDGELDLSNETIDADMLVNVPVSQGLSVIAGMLGAWPIAIGTYIGGKIFKDQLESFTTVLYRLEGPWSELNAGFEPDNNMVIEEIEDAGVL